MPFSVEAYLNNHALTVSAETAQEAFAKAVEWHVVGRFSDVTISDGIKSYSLEDFSSVIEDIRQP